MISDYMIEKMIEFSHAIETGLVDVCIAVVIITIVAVMYCIISMIREWLDR